MSKKKPEQTSPLERYKKTVLLIEEQRVIILLTGETVDHVFDAAEHLTGEGHRIFGIDYKIPGVSKRLKSLKRMGERRPGVYSISTAKDARNAINAGAEFVFSTHPDKSISGKCGRERIFHGAGALTPKEVKEANDLGADAVSLYPCSAMGGTDWLMRLKEMFPAFKYIPTDVMTPGEVREYLKAGAYAAAPIIDAGNIEEARKLIRGIAD